MLITLDQLKTALIEVKKRLVALGKLLTPDWGAAPGEEGFIRNRTHWKEGDVYHKLDPKFLPTAYVGPDVTRRSQSDLGWYSLGAYVGVPAGYYEDQCYYYVPTMTLPTSASSTSSGSSRATITPSTSTQYINIPSGYNDSSRYYTISAVTYSKITVSTANPSGGANGDVWIKT